MSLMYAVYDFLWADLITIPLPNGSSLGLSLLVLLFIGCLATYTFVWDLGDVGIGLMTIFNMLVLLPMSKEALICLKEYEGMMKARKQK